MLIIMVTNKQQLNWLKMYINSSYGSFESCKSPLDYYKIMQSLKVRIRRSDERKDKIKRLFEK